MLRPHCHCGCPVKVGSFGGILRSPYDRDYLLVIIGLLSQIVYKLNLNNYCDQSDRSIPLKLPTFTGRPEVTGWPKHPKCKNEFVFRFSYFTFENEKRKRNSFLVFRSQIWKRKTKKEFVFRSQNLKTKNEKGIRFSFANLKTKKEKTVYTRTEVNNIW